MIRCNTCPNIVEWKSISFQPLLSIMRSINLEESTSVLIPEHLYKDGIRQFQIVISLPDDYNKNNIDYMLYRSGISWDSIDFEKNVIWGGIIFRIPGKKGYWTLHAPCLSCYINNYDESILNQMVILRKL